MRPAGRNRNAEHGRPGIRIAGALVVCAASLAAAPPLHAQESETIREREATGAESRDAARRAILAIEGAEDLGAEITYDRILADPDDIALNFRYAKQQMSQGRFKAAAGTLERILLIQPELPEVRLYYAVVLFRLDSPDEAETQFRLIQDMEMPPALRQTIDGYLEEISNRRKTTRYTVQVSLGPHFDRNRNSASRTGRNLVLDTDSELDGDDRRESDWGFQSSLTASMRHDLGTQERHELTASATLYDDSQMERDDLSSRLGQLNGGAVLHFERFDLTPEVFFGKTYLSHERYETTWGGSLKLDVPITQEITGSISAKYTDQKYYGITETTSAYLYSGYQWDLKGGMSFVLSPAHKLDASWTHTVKRAQAYYYEYAGNTAALAHTWLLGGGQFLLSALDVRYRVYREEDTSISARTRFDKRVRARVTYGLPVTTLLAALGDDEIPDLLEGWTWSHTGEYLHQNANIINYDYRNWRYQTLLSKRWEF